MSAAGGALDFRPEPGGKAVRVRLRVSAGAAKSRVLGSFGGALKLSVRTAPERGRANREVISVVAEALGVAPSALELVAGETSPDKVVRVSLAPEDAAARWEACVGRLDQEAARKRAGKGSP